MPASFLPFGLPSPLLPAWLNASALEPQHAPFHLLLATELRAVVCLADASRVVIVVVIALLPVEFAILATDPAPLSVLATPATLATLAIVGRRPPFAYTTARLVQPVLAPQLIASPSRFPFFS